MGNKSLSTPIAPYDQAIQHLNANELTQLRHRFAKMRYLLLTVCVMVFIIFTAAEDPIPLAKITFSG